MPKPLVLCYHAVSDSWSDELAVGSEAIERQLRAFLRLGYRPATAAETLVGSGKRLHVTFDDAYRSIGAALPALSRLGVPATVFACADYADDGRALAVAELAGARANERELATMDWDNLRALVERGVEIGSHTLTHPHLTRLSDDDLHRELTASRERIEDELRRPCRFLAYPYGEHDLRTRTRARLAGYEAAFALAGGDTGSFDLYARPRLGVWRKDGLGRVVLKSSPPGRLASRVIAGRRAARA